MAQGYVALDPSPNPRKFKGNTMAKSKITTGKEVTITLDGKIVDGAKLFDLKQEDPNVEVKSYLDTIDGMRLSYLIEGIERKTGCSFGIGGTPTQQQAKPQPDPQVPKLKTEIARLQEALVAIAEQPSLYANVLKVTPTRVVLLVSGKKVEVPKPKLEAKDKKEQVIKIGNTVKVTADKFAILEIIDMGGDTGELCTLTNVFGNGTGEIERAGTSRVITLPNTSKSGDRVVVDESGTIALENLGPKENTSTFGEETGVTWDDIGGLVEAKAQLRDAVEGPYTNKYLYQRFGKKPCKGILLYGSPGNGKTLLGKAAATAIREIHGAKAKGGFFYVKGPELMDMYVGNTEANIRKMFDDARRHHKENGFPAVIFLDEADAILGKRGSHGFGLEKTIVPQFLSEMDGFEATGAIVMIATNRPDVLDPAVIRDGRVDRRIHVTRPTQQDASLIAMKNLQNKPLDGSAHELSNRLAEGVFSGKYPLLKLFRKSKGELSDKLLLSHTVSGSMIVGVVERAVSQAISRNGEGINGTDIDNAIIQSYNESLDVNHEDEILEVFGGSISPTDISKVVKGKPMEMILDV